MSDITKATLAPGWQHCSACDGRGALDYAYCHECKGRGRVRLPLDFLNPLDQSSLTDCIQRVSALGEATSLGVLLYLGIQTHARLDPILKELSRMATIDQTLTDAVSALTGAFSDFELAIADEIADIKAALPVDADPALTTAVSNIDTLIAKMQADTAAAKAAVTPPAAAAVPATPAAGDAPAAVADATGATT